MTNLGLNIPKKRPWLLHNSWKIKMLANKSRQLNPADYFLKIKCPVLAINGTLDMQVNSEANLNGIKTSLIKGGNNKFEIVPLAGLNHLLQKATTGSVNEYAQISETVNPLALQKVSDWINRL